MPEVKPCPRLPQFLLKKTPKSENIRRLRQVIENPQVHTVCEEAKCPNIGECYAQSICTFLLLGAICTRSCAYCGVSQGHPLPPDPDEPTRIAEAAQKLGLNYVVLTSVTRDDLPDGGARHFAAVIQSLKNINPSIEIEVLIPDFQGEKASLQTVLDARPRVLNHNLETVPRLYPTVRPQANFERSLQLLQWTRELSKSVYTKSGFMVGLGESDEEVLAVLSRLREVDCDIVTIGQYLPPSRLHPKPERYVDPAVFLEWEKIGSRMGFLRVEAGPFVRSSYHAADLIRDKLERKVFNSRNSRNWR